MTIPKPIRDRLGLVPGARVAFEVDPDGRVVLRKAEDPVGPADDPLDHLIGCGTALKGLSTDEIMRLLRGGDDSDL